MYDNEPGSEMFPCDEWEGVKALSHVTLHRILSQIIYFVSIVEYSYRDFQLMGNQDDVNIIIAPDIIRWKIDMQIELSG